MKTKKNLTTSITVLLVSALLLLSMNISIDTALGAEDWNYETVDSDGDVGCYSSVAIDDDHRPHIGYYDDTNGNLKYAAWTGSGWWIDTVDSDGDVGMSTSIALDGTGNPHISYYDSTNGNLKYTRRSGGTWNTETVDSDGSVGFYASIVLDANGRPHISYFDNTNVNLKYARWTGSEWSIETVDSNGDVGSSTSITLDSDGNPHISYYDGNLNLKYARWTGSQWNIETVDNINEGDFPRGTSIALDSHDNPHISYSHSHPLYDLKYARWTGTEWMIETVDSDITVGDVSSIALDGSDNPHITYGLYGTNNFLRYARWTGTEWTTVIPDTSGDSVGSRSSMVLDSIGNAYISYRDDGNQNLKYARSIIDAPDAPQNLQAVPGDKQISLSWEAPSDDGGGSIIGYNIHRGESSGNLSYHDTVDAGTFSFNDTVLTNGQTYYYIVSAENGAGEGEFTEEANAMPVGLPSSPGNLAAGAGDEQVTLSWDTPADDGGSDITGYRIYRGEVSGNLSYHYGVAGDIYSYIDIGLTNDQIYHYQVSAVNDVGEGDRSEEVSATPSSDMTIPSAPRNLQRSAGDEQVTLSWDPPAEDGGSDITGYNIYRGTTSGSLSLHQSVSGSTYVDTGLTNDQIYYYQVSAVNGVGEGPLSTEVNVTPFSEETNGESDTDEPDKDFLSSYWWIFLILIICVIVLLAIVLLVRKKETPVSEPMYDQPETPPAQPEQTPAVVNESLATKLEELQDMKNRGLITEEEFQTKKKDILDRF